MARRNYTEQDDPLTYAIIGCAMKVHSKLGPALNEGVYDECMFTELSKARLEFRHHPAIRVPYDGKLLDRFYRPDFVIESQVILEVKAVEHVLPVLLRGDRNALVTSSETTRTASSVRAGKPHS